MYSAVHTPVQRGIGEWGDFFFTETQISNQKWKSQDVQSDCIKFLKKMIQGKIFCSRISFVLLPSKSFLHLVFSIQSCCCLFEIPPLLPLECWSPIIYHRSFEYDLTFEKFNKDATNLVVTVRLIDIRCLQSSSTTLSLAPNLVPMASFLQQKPTNFRFYEKEKRGPGYEVA